MATAEAKLSDYSLTPENSARAIEQGLAEANWYTSPVPREKMRELLTRRDGPAIRDTFIWFALIFASGYWAFSWWGSWWAIIPFAIYGVLYASVSDSRWHESGHGTAFKTDWMNNALYEIASFMVMRESVVWRWSHTRHHSDTIIVGRDREIHVPRPPDIPDILSGFIVIKGYPQYFKSIILHSFGKMSDEEKLYIPESEFEKIFFRARIYVLIYATVIGAAFYFQSILPLMYIGLTNLYGSWLMVVYGLTQHAGLAENVLDHRLNCRTVYMNFINRFCYWNMNFHLEHHMFPLVPYHNLPQLHDLVKDDCPTPYSSIPQAYKEIIPTILRQVKEPTYYVKRELPTPSPEAEEHRSHKFVSKTADKSKDGWIEICSAQDLQKEDVLRFDCDAKTYAVYRTSDDKLYATDGICTHGNTHLADGFVKGNLIECPKHNGRFDVRDGSIQRPPVCVALRTYTVEEREGMLYLDLNSAGGCGLEEEKKAKTFQVVSNDNVATFIKELVLEPAGENANFKFTPGDYIQLQIPNYELTSFKSIEVNEPYAEVWRDQDLFQCRAKNETMVRRNYSMATNPETDKQIRFNVRIATPPPGVNCHAGTGSSYVFNLKPGDEVKAIGPFGDFHIKETEKEMVYIGGGAGMAPLRSHLSYLFETLKTKRKVSFWYGARSLQEMFYTEYFEELAKKHDNFSFHVALSEPQPEDDWKSHTGFIHEIVKKEHLTEHSDPKQIEYYLCGPPLMIEACTKMLEEYNVSSDQIAYDEF